VRTELYLPRDARGSRQAERLTEQVAVISEPVGVIRQIERLGGQLDLRAGQAQGNGQSSIELEEPVIACGIPNDTRGAIVRCAVSIVIPASDDVVRSTASNSDERSQSSAKRQIYTAASNQLVGGRRSWRDHVRLPGYAGPGV
jgi:hypothetical protein